MPDDRISLAKELNRMQEDCGIFWGSHGCDLPPDGHKVHQCGREPNAEELAAVEEGDLDPDTLGPCCRFDERTGEVSFYYGDDEWGAWGGDWKGFRL